MKFVTDFFIAGFVLFAASMAHSDVMRENAVRAAALRAGLTPTEELRVDTDPALVEVGHQLFQSRILSFSEDTACASCHVDRFGSADGLPIALGTGAEGFGVQRIHSGGDIIPRNAQALWGRGGRGFDTFFSDGRVQLTGEVTFSQFGSESPSDDPLIVSVHLPPVEIGEMLSGDIDYLQTETVESAHFVYDEIVDRIVADNKIGAALALARNKDIVEIEFLDIALALGDFIRFNYAIHDTKFHEFVFGQGKLEGDELRGALIFYGRGGCVSCHRGAYFSDFEFHALPFPQFGFGANGFGIDYGRFNVTLNTDDLYAFRTPPLYDVIETAPYSHSGSVMDIGTAIQMHFDPLRFIDTGSMSHVERVDFYERMQRWADTPLNGVILSDSDVEDLVAFLGTLDVESRLIVDEID